MMNPARALSRLFLYLNPTALLVLGVGVAVADLSMNYGAATRDGVLRINQGAGLLNHYGYFATITGNAIGLYAARKYYDAVCSIKTSRAVLDTSVIDPSLAELTSMIRMEGRYIALTYLLVAIGGLFFLENLRILLSGDSLAKWGPVYDSLDHRWSFFAGRFHLLYSWVIIMPLGVHVILLSSVQLWRTMGIASRARSLTYDLLNPDHRGGFGFVDTAVIAFNLIVALVYVEITLHIETFRRINLEHMFDYAVLTLLLIGINRMFFAHIYGMIKKLRFESLNQLKDDVFRNDKLSFEILKYCYERRVNTASVASFIIKAGAIAVPQIVRLWPSIVRALTPG